MVKLREGSALRAWVFAHVRRGWSPHRFPASSAGSLTTNNSRVLVCDGFSRDDLSAIYVLPRGQIRKSL